MGLGHLGGGEGGGGRGVGSSHGVGFKYLNGAWIGYRIIPYPELRKGLRMSSSNRKTTYQKQLKGGRINKSVGPGQNGRRDALEKNKQRELGDSIDAKFGFSRFTDVFNALLG